MGHYEVAEPLLRQSLAARRSSLPPGHATIEEALARLEECLTKLGRPVSSDPLIAEDPTTD
jgi:hypothetical protein